MAFVKKTWKSRLSEYPNRRILTDENQVQTRVVVSRDEGQVTEQGDAFSAANMNDLENRIQAAFGEDGYSQATLYAGQSTVTFTEDWITDDICYDVAMPLQYSKVIYSKIEFLSPHTIRLTFPVQTTNITVRLYKK